MVDSRASAGTPSVLPSSADRIPQRSEVKTSALKWLEKQLADDTDEVPGKLPAGYPAQYIASLSRKKETVRNLGAFRCLVRSKRQRVKKACGGDDPLRDSCGAPLRGLLAGAFCLLAANRTRLFCLFWQFHVGCSLILLLRHPFPCPAARPYSLTC